MLFDHLEFNFLDVGQGDGTFIICPEGETILVDLGSKKNADVAGKDAIKYLHDELIKLQEKRKLSQPTIDYLFLTHPDGDHYNLLPQLAASFKSPEKSLLLKQIIIGGVARNYRTIDTSILKPADKAKILATLPEQAHDAVGKPSLRLSKSTVNVYILCANVYGPTNYIANPKSIVLMFEYAGRKVILTGDAEELSENLIMSWYGAAFLKSEALKLGHHGSKNGTKSKWIQTVQPRMAFASSDMKWAHPYCETIKRLSDSGYLWAIKEHPWLCGSGYSSNKEYASHSSKCGVYTTLAVQNPKDEEMTDDSEKEVILKVIEDIDPDGALPEGMVLGTQYVLDIYPAKSGQSQGDMEIRCEINDKLFDTGRFASGTPSKCLGEYWPDSTETIPVAMTKGDECGCC